MTTKALTVQEVLGLPAMPTAQDAFAACGISEDLGYQLIRDNEFPVQVIRLGARALRVRRSDLLNFLGLTEEDGASPVYQPGESAGNSEAAGYQPAAPSEQSAPTCQEENGTRS